MERAWVRRAMAGTATMALVCAVGVGGVVAQGASGAVPTERIAGADRVATAVAISQRSFSSGLAGEGTVYLARKDVFADALSAGILTDGPVLLMPSCAGVPSVVVDEIARLDPSRVVALGGEQAICEESLTAAADGRAEGRIAGANRYETSAAIAKARAEEGPVTRVYVASGQNSPDAVAGGSLTAGPIVLVKPTGGPSLTVAASVVENLDPEVVVGLGGSVALPQNALDAVAGGTPVERLAGANRYGTAGAIADAQFGEGAPVAYLARGDIFADAIAAGSLTDGPVLLIDDCTLPQPTADVLTRLGPDTVVALGGTQAVCDEVLTQAASVVDADPGISTVRVSVASDGAEGDGGAGVSSISADGRFVAFDSGATNLVPDDTNYAADVFVHDREMGVTKRVSVASDGTEAAGSSFNPLISADGRYVAFSSWAANLVPGDVPKVGGGDPLGKDVFVHDLETGETTRASVRSDGTGVNNYSIPAGISEHGRYVAFTTPVPVDPSDTDFDRDVFVHDRGTGETTRVSVAADGSDPSGASLGSGMSVDGRYIVFWSESALVADDTNDAADVFVHDRMTGETTRVSVSSDDTQAVGHYTTGEVLIVADVSADISADGRYVAFTSTATNLVMDDTNDAAGVFVHDRETGETQRLAIPSDSAVLTDSRGGEISISAHGRYVSFSSSAPNVVPGDTNDVADVFVHDRMTEATHRVTVAGDGSESNGMSNWPRISDDGRYLSFTSWASNIVAGDSNDQEDVFVVDLGVR